MSDGEECSKNVFLGCHSDAVVGLHKEPLLILIKELQATDSRKMNRKEMGIPLDLLLGNKVVVEIVQVLRVAVMEAVVEISLDLGFGIRILMNTHQRTFSFLESDEEDQKAHTIKLSIITLPKASSGRICSKTAILACFV